jgi:hypothetical protein
VPEGGEWVLNRAIETRRQMPVVAFSYRHPLAEHVPVARAFIPAREVVAREREEKRRLLIQNWPKVAPLPAGEFTAFAPYAFLHREQPEYMPSVDEKKRAEMLVPVHARREFIHQRMDSRSPIVFTFVRRPGYYAVFNSGKLITRQQRLGLGLLWTPAEGAILQNQTNSADAAWGTRAAGMEQVYEAAVLQASFSTGEPHAGARVLDVSTLTLEYPLGATGRKRVAFERDIIRVTIEHPGEFTEQIPSLGGGMRLEPAPAPAPATQTKIAGKPLRVLRFNARDRLEYSIRPR